jgi:hypothetical protein
LNTNEFFAGVCYESNWIFDSIKKGELLDKDEYFWKTIPFKGCKKMKFNAVKTSFTMMEGVKVF